jgi:hypothetical protein
MLLPLALKEGFCWHGDMVWIWCVVRPLLIYYLLGAILIPLTPLSYFLAFMVLLYIKIKLCYKTLFWMWEEILMALGYVLVTLI